VSPKTAPPALKPQWFQILLALADQDLHGYAIMKDVLERTGGRMRLWPGMLYGSLKRMVAARMIEEIEPSSLANEDDVDRRFYRITRLGKRSLAEEASRMAEYVAVARDKRVLGKGKPA
jgi:DNA-binding PadR family transcriptional regulator